MRHRKNPAMKSDTELQHDIFNDYANDGATILMRGENNHGVAKAFVDNLGVGVLLVVPREDLAHRLTLTTRRPPWMSNGKGRIFGAMHRGLLPAEATSLL